MTFLFGINLIYRVFNAILWFSFVPYRSNVVLFLIFKRKIKGVSLVSSRHVTLCTQTVVIGPNAHPFYAAVTAEFGPDAGPQ